MSSWAQLVIIKPIAGNYGHQVCHLPFLFLLTAPIAIVFTTDTFIYLGINCTVSQSKGIKPDANRCRSIYIRMNKICEVVRTGGQ